MTYCFVRVESGDRDETGAVMPSFHKFNYSSRQHAQTKQDLQRLTAGLTKAIAQLEAGHEDAAFPKVDEAKGLCDRCPFALRCDRAQSAFPNAASQNDPYQLLRAARQITVESVEEIPL